MYAPLPNSITHSRNSGGISSAKRPNLRVPPQRFHALPDRFDGTPGRLPALGGEKIMLMGDIQQRRSGPLQARHFGGATLLARFKFGQPGVGFFGSGMQAGHLILGPGGESVPPQLLPLLFALYVLFDGFAHKPVRRPAACVGKALHTLFYLGIELQTGRRSLWHGGVLWCYLVTL